MWLLLFKWRSESFWKVNWSARETQNNIEKIGKRRKKKKLNAFPRDILNILHVLILIVINFKVINVYWCSGSFITLWSIAIHIQINLVRHRKHCVEICLFLYDQHWKSNHYLRSRDASNTIGLPISFVFLLKTRKFVSLHFWGWPQFPTPATQTICKRFHCCLAYCFWNYLTCPILPNIYFSNMLNG